MNLYQSHKPRLRKMCATLLVAFASATTLITFGASTVNSASFSAFSDFQKTWTINTMANSFTFNQAIPAVTMPAQSAMVYPANWDSNSLSALDEDSTSVPFPLGFPVSVSGNTFTSVYVNNNGNITFDSPSLLFNRAPLSFSSYQIIAPFMANVDTSDPASDVVKYGNVIFQGKPAFSATWGTDTGNGVGYFNAHSDKLNKFQVLLVDRSSDTGISGDFDIIFNYDKIQWDNALDDSCVSCPSARVGFALGGGVLERNTTEISGSAIDGSFLDNNPDNSPNPNALIARSRNSGGLNGRYVFEIRNSNAVFPATVSGTVTGLVPGNPPVANAVVKICSPISFDCRYTSSDANGNYSLTGVPDGDFILKVDGESAGFGNTEIPNLKISDSAFVQNVQLYELGQISGTVTGPTSSSPVSGATVEYCSEVLDGCNTVVTDNSGHYSITLLQDDNWDVTVTAPQGSGLQNSSTSTFTILNGNRITNADFNLIAGGTIQGQITVFDSGAPLAGAKVQACSTSICGRYVFSDAMGNYSLDGLPAGTFTVTAQTPTAYSTISGIILNSMETLTGQNIAIDVPTANIEGHILIESSGAPIAGAGVTTCASSGWPCAYTFSDVNGHYVLSTLPDGNYEVRADPPPAYGLRPDYAPVSISGGNTMTGINISLSPWSEIGPGTGLTPFHGSSNGPVVYWGNDLTLTRDSCANGVATYVVSGDATRSGSLTEIGSGTGHYVATVPRFYPETGVVTFTITVTCPNSSVDSTSFDVYIDPSGRVLDNNGNPVPGATVTLFRSDTIGGPFVQVPAGSLIMRSSNRNNPDTTAADGRYGWDVIPGYYKVRVEKSGYIDDFTGNAFAITQALIIPPPRLDVDFTLRLVNHAPVAITRNISRSLISSCSVSISPSDIDNGSYDPDAGDTISRSISPSGPFGAGIHTVTLTVTDNHNAQSSSSATLTVTDAKPPTANASLTRNVRVSNTEGVFTTVYSGAPGCTNSLSSVTGLMEIPTGANSFSVKFSKRTDGISSVEIDYSKRKIQLYGPTDAGMRSVLSQILTAGGASVSNGQTLGLAKLSTLESRFTFYNGTLVALEGNLLRLKVKVLDSAGRVATATATPIF